MEEGAATGPAAIGELGTGGTEGALLLLNC